MSAAAVAALPLASAPLVSGDYIVAAPGRVEPASEEIRVSAAVTGLLKEMVVKEGDKVRRGDVLARLESDEYQAALAKAQAAGELSEAELNRVLNGARQAERQAARAAVEEADAMDKNASLVLGRLHTLGSQGVASIQAVDQAERDYFVARARLRAAREKYALIDDPPRDEDVAIAKARLAAARAAVREAQSLLDKTVIRSPIDGTILGIYRRPGELVSTYFVDQPILSIGDLSTLYVRAEIDEADIGKLQLGLPAYVTADAFGSSRFMGKIIHVGEKLGQKKVHSDAPTERSDTKVLEVLIELNSPNPLRPGLRVNTFVTSPAVSAVTSPAMSARSQDLE
jgi:ABC exporter DevB family membrane fusion protein